MYVNKQFSLNPICSRTAETTAVERIIWRSLPDAGPAGFDSDVSLYYVFDHPSAAHSNSPQGLAPCG